MNKSSITPAKVSVPQLRLAYERIRLFERLDAAGPVTWISAPPGSGKTALLATYIKARKRHCLWYQMDAGDNDLANFFYYLGLAAKKAAPRARKPLPALTPEYLPGLAIFARRYFEELAARLPYGTAIIVDDYHTVAADAPLHEVVLNSLEQVAAGMSLVIISREPPPAVFARALLHGTLTRIDPDELRMTEDEAYEFAQMYVRGKSGPSRTEVRNWHEQTQGWMAGLVLALNHKMQDGKDLSDTAPQVMFDYFAQEIFEHTQADTRQLLLVCAFVPKVTAAIAQALSGMANAADRLEWLRRKNYFTSRRGNDAIYEFHPLFRAFLLEHARIRFSAEQLLKVRQHAAMLLEEAGEIEAAVPLLQVALDWGNLTRLIAQHAPMLLAEGRWQTLQSWINALPAEYQNLPWTRFWLGMSRLLLSPKDAQQDFAHAFSIFESSGDMLGQWLAWSGVVESFLYAWDDFTGLDPWIDRLDTLIKRNAEFPSVDIELRVINSAFGALLYRQPQHPLMLSFIARLEMLLLQSTNSDLRVMAGANLVNYYTWNGNFNLCLNVINSMHTYSNPQTPPLLIIWQWAHELSYYWNTGAFAECINLMDKGLAFSRHHGIFVLELPFLTQSVFALIGSGDLTRAAEVLAQSEKWLNPQRRLEVAFYHYVAGWLALRQGDIPSAERHARMTLTLSNQMGALFPRALSQFALAQVLIKQENYPAARLCLKESRLLGRELNSAITEYTVLLSEAYLALIDNNEALALSLLRDALAIGKANRIINPPWWMPKMMSPLMALALKAGIEVDFAKELIRTLKLEPDNTSADIERWPWPVRVYTFGNFRLVRDGEPVRFSGRTQKKSLDLLKALIASGGSEVSEQKVCDVLWPDAEADDARANLKMTLHRLRGLIGQESVTLQESRLSLNPSTCWVDVWAFEQNANRLTAPSAAFPMAELESIGERMLSLYRGPFLGDEEQIFALAARERLRGKWMRVIAVIAEGLQHDSGCDRAQIWYERGIDVEPLAEPFYQGLMRACLACGRIAEGLAVYARLSRILAAELQITPSPDTEALARALNKTSP